MWELRGGRWRRPAELWKKRRGYEKCGTSQHHSGSVGLAWNSSVIRLLLHPELVSEGSPEIMWVRGSIFSLLCSCWGGEENLGQAEVSIWVEDGMEGPPSHDCNRNL